MHTKNGLIGQVRSSQISLREAEIEILEFVSQNVAYKRGHLAGNSIYTDRRFLQKYFPTLEGYLHYRQIDVTSIKILAAQWYRGKAKAPKTESNHTALDDIRGSIEELKYYRQQCFKTL